MKIEILGIGEVCLDWVAEVDHFPAPDEKIDSIKQSNFAGGVTANYCAGVARLGGNVGFYGAIGKDEQGQFLVDDFKNEGVDISDLYIHDSSSTPVNFIFVVQSSGEKVIIQSPYMHTTIPPNDTLSLENENLSELKLIHTSGIYPELILRIFKDAQNKNILTSLDLEKQVIHKHGTEKIKEILANVDILLPNKEGAMEFTNMNTPEEAAKKFLDFGIKICVITLGREGALAASKDGVFKVPAYNIKPIDTTGAGDTFCAMFCFAMTQGYSIEKALKYSNASAAIKCLKMGARTGMPNLKQVEEFISEHE